jgi:hypothetical protein
MTAVHVDCSITPCIFDVHGSDHQAAERAVRSVEGFEQAESTDWFGWSVTGPLDADGDGFFDLVIGAPGDGSRGSFLPGKVHLLLGPLSGVVSAADADRSWLGDEAGSSTGAGLAVGDFDGDTVTDLVIGAPDHATTAGAQAGRVYLLLGPLLGP